MFGVTGLRCSMLTAGGTARSDVRVRYGVWGVFWSVGHLAGGALAGAAFGALGLLIPAQHRTWAVAALSVACLAWALHQFGLVSVPMPQVPRQVRREWMTRVPWNLVAIGYGLELGSAVMTRISTTTIYAAIVCAVLSGPRAGAIVLATFGITRAIAPLWMGPALDDPSRSLRFAVAVSRWEPWVARANGAALVIASVLLATYAGHRVW